MPIPVAEKSKVWVWDHSRAGNAGSNPAGDTNVCLWRVLCVVSQRSLLRADTSSRGVCVCMCVCVCVCVCVIQCHQVQQQPSTPSTKRWIWGIQVNWFYFLKYNLWLNTRLCQLPKSRTATCQYVPCIVSVRVMWSRFARTCEWPQNMPDTLLDSTMEHSSISRRKTDMNKPLDTNVQICISKYSHHTSPLGIKPGPNAKVLTPHTHTHTHTHKHTMYEFQQNIFGLF
jgi:hypothetical protein